MDRPGSLAEITMRSCRPLAIATARAPCASRCERRNPSTPVAIVPIARLGPSPCFWAMGADRGHCVRRFRAERQPSVSAQPVGRDEQRVRVCPRGLGEFPDETAAARRVRLPRCPRPGTT